MQPNPAQQKAIEDAMDYIMQVIRVQKRVWPVDLIYRDGTLFPILTKKCFEMCYESVIEALKQTGEIT